MDTKKRPKNTAWITWEVQVRNRSMANSLNVPLYELISKRGRLFKYPFLLFQTLMILVKERIKILFVQNPSIVLSFFAICLKPLLNMRVIIDAHNSGIFPLEGKSRALNFLARFIGRRADIIIVTNRYLADIVLDWDGNPFVLPDPIPDFSQHQHHPLNYNRPFVLFVCTWADDEPYFEVIEAARAITHCNIDILMTGNFKKRLTESQICSIPENVRLTGFISEESYVDHLHQAITVIDLTTRDNCLVCGGYEAAATGTPAILSDIQVNREIFNKGYIYTANSAEAISIAIAESLIQQYELRAQINEFRQEHQLLINTRIKELGGLAGLW